MALSGTINGGTSNQYIDTKIEWSATQNIAGNYSVVVASLYYRRNNTGFTTEGTGNFTITINGTSKTSSAVHLVIRTAWVLATTANITVPHNSDGSKTITVSASGSLPGTTLSNTYCSGSVSLNTIPRQSKFSYITSSLILNGGTSIAYTITRYSTAYTHKIKMEMGSYNKTLSVSATTGSTTIPIDWLYAMPNTRVGTIIVTLTTYNGSTQIGDQVTAYVKAYVPESVKPKILTFSVEKAAGCKEPSDWGNYVQGCSKIELFLSVSLENIYGSKIKKLTITGNGVAHTVSGVTHTSVISDYIPGSGILTYKAIAEDMRGSTDELTVDISVDPYAPPMPENCVAFRCIEDGTANDTGTYMGVKSGCKFSSCGGRNSAFLKVYWRKAGTTAWQPTNGISIQTNALTVIDQLISLYDAYEILITASDLINTNPPSISKIIVHVRTTQVSFMLKRGGKGASFGRMAEEDYCLDVRDWKGRFDSLVVGGESIVDYIVETGMESNWYYRKWLSGYLELYYKSTMVSIDYGSTGSAQSAVQRLTAPDMLLTTYSYMLHATLTGWYSYATYWMDDGGNTISWLVRTTDGNAMKGNHNCRLHCEIKGTWK